MILLDNLIEKIKSCGSVAIKFCQWSIPKLEVMHLEKEDIHSGSKPLWLRKLENFYENCENHSLEYTLNKYKETFKNNLQDDYEVIDIIGSGSIGQVYLLREKTITKCTTPKKYVMKILHPNVKNEICYFRYYYNLIRRMPIFKKILNENFPFDINGFIDSFEEQSDFINESNHLLKFQECYKDNQMIIIPRLIKCSSNVMIMSYEEGIPFDRLTCDNYSKYKIVLLLVSFIRNNQEINNFNHGDLHKGNWKVKEDKLVIYDFGFSWKVPAEKLYGNELIIKVFEDSNSEDIDVQKLVEVFKFLVINGNNHGPIIGNYINNNLNLIKPWNLDPHRILKIAIQMCMDENLKLDPLLIQSLIIVIQCEKIFSEFNILSTDKYTISSREVYREKYLDWLSYYKSNDIFHDYSKLIIEKLNEKQPEVDSIFDCSEMPESIKNLALKNI
tara:strand:- start:723 stop:2054 length:1332 start_codon:yes stop_codon:yes gene_type:complete